MKKEPLKNKKVFVAKTYKMATGITNLTPVVLYSDLDSAVEWLKKEILYTEIQQLKDNEINDILKLIDKAFPDLKGEKE